MYVHVCTQLYDNAALIGAVRPGIVHEAYRQVTLLTVLLTHDNVLTFHYFLKI